MSNKALFLYFNFGAKSVISVFYFIISYIKCLKTKMLFGGTDVSFNRTYYCGYYTILPLGIYLYSVMSQSILYSWVCFAFYVGYFLCTALEDVMCQTF